MRPLAGRYELGDPIGRGGMSVVLRAHDRTLGKDVALKIIASNRTADRRLRRLVRAEAAYGGRVEHPHVARIYDDGIGRVPGRGRVPFVVMELLDGVTLAERLMSGPLPWPVALRVCGQIASAVAATHRAGVLHRDVNPANVMLVEEGAKLMDFGFAAAIDDPDADPAGLVLGTMEYLAPERWAGGAAVASTDVYGIGLTLYECLAGTRPWPGRTGSDLMSARVHLRPQPLPLLDGLPMDVPTLVLRCLAPEPLDRPPALIVAEALLANRAPSGARRSLVGAGNGR